MENVSVEVGLVPEAGALEYQVYWAAACALVRKFSDHEYSLGVHREDGRVIVSIMSVRELRGE